VRTRFKAAIRTPHTLGHTTPAAKLPLPAEVSAQDLKGSDVSRTWCGSAALTAKAYALTARRRKTAVGGGCIR
jgi:hypothetical protein